MSAHATTVGWVRFRPSMIHGHGGFAAAPALADTLLIEYLGERITKEESHRRCEVGNPFIFELDELTDLDGNVEWNPARWINHSCAPNCTAENHDGRIWIVSRRDLLAGEELTFNYGYDLTDYRDFPCRCGAANCVGFMVAEEYFARVRFEQLTGPERPDSLAPG